MWPSLAAEINAVQQSYTHRQPVTLGTAIRLQIQLEKCLSKVYLGPPGLVKAMYLPVGHTRCSWEHDVAWTYRSVRELSVKDNTDYSI